MKRKTLIYICLAVAVIAGWMYLHGKANSKTFEWRTMPVKRGDVNVVVTATGTINADTSVDVGTQVTGIIAKLYADWNSVVKKGQIIALIDTTFFSASRIDAQATLDKAQAQLEQAKRDYDRNKQLVDEKVIAQSDYETYLTNYETAKAAVMSAKAQLNHALINLQYSIIRAPVNGTVISRNVELGQTVVASFNSVTLYTIANDLTKMRVMANVDEADIGQVKVGQKATFTVDAYPDQLFTGTVNQVRIQPMIVQNVVNYIVVIDVPNPDLKLMPGLTANINIQVQGHTDVLKVAANAFHFTPPMDYIAQTRTLPDSIKQGVEKGIYQNKENISRGEKNKSAYLWIKKGSDIYPKKVTLGLTDGNYTEVSGDIKEDDLVVIGQGALPANLNPPKSPFMPTMPSKKKT